MAPNILYLDIILGGDLIKLGLGLWPAIGVIVVGNLYWVLVGLVSVSGARSGTAGVVVMRAMFGVRGNRINVAIVVWGINVAFLIQGRSLPLYCRSRGITHVFQKVLPG